MNVMSCYVNWMIKQLSVIAETDSDDCFLYKSAFWLTLSIFGNNANHKKYIFVWKVQIRSMGSMESASIIIALKLYSSENDTNSSIAGSKPQAFLDREGEQERLRKRVSPPDCCKRWTESWWGRWAFLWRGGSSPTCCLVGKQCQL